MLNNILNFLGHNSQWMGLLMSALSFVTSLLTLGVVYKVVEQMETEAEELRTKTNKVLGDLNHSLTDFTV